MALVVPNVGEVLMLGYITSNNFTLRLFTNDLVPDSNTSIGDMTEVSWSGYSGISLTSGGWTLSNSSGTETAACAVQTFTFESTSNPTLNIYGYYITDSTPQIAWIERFANAPFEIPPAGGEVNITPRITLATA